MMVQYKLNWRENNDRITKLGSSSATNMGGNNIVV